MAEQETVAELLARGIAAARERRREEALELLLQVVEKDPNSEAAWLWLSGVVADPRDMQVALANALTINPGNEQARKGLEALRQRDGNLLSPEEEPPTVATGQAPPPAPAISAEEEEILTLLCYKCGTQLYSVAHFCWNCNAVVHCCENCVQRRETECKERYGIRGPAAAVVVNQCPEWTPEVVQGET